jgi:phage tail sheath gpL-like
MPLDATSIAAAVGSTAQNVTFAIAAENVPRKILVIGTYDPLKTGVVAEVPVQVLSAADAGDKFGFGFPVHRLVKKAFEGSNGIECWVQPQSEVAGLQALGSIVATGPATAAGTIYLYIAGDVLTIPIASGDDATAIGDAIETAINAERDLPITALNAAGTVTTTAKDTSVYGNDVNMAVNLGLNQELPAGVALVFTQQTGGTGLPDIDDALDGLGTGDAANDANFTDMVHSYGPESTVIPKVSTYGGIGNDFVGLYTKTIGRPFRCLMGDTAVGSAGLTAAKAVGNGNLEDRTNGLLSVPGSPNHPAEIAACAIGVMARINQNRAGESYIGKTIPGIIPAPTDASGDRWTDDDDNRNSALLAGVSPTRVQNNAVKLQNVATFYHPAGVSTASNAYRSMRNISIIQNVLFNNRLNFEAEKWQGISIVADIAKVTNSIDREKARDRNAVIGDLLALTEEYEGHAWIYSASFTVNQLQSDPTLVEIRVGGDGFTMKLPLVLSGEGGIFDTVAQVDASLAVFLT